MSKDKNGVTILIGDIVQDTCREDDFGTITEVGERDFDGVKVRFSHGEVYRPACEVEIMGLNPHESEKRTKALYAELREDYRVCFDDLHHMRRIESAFSGVDFSIDELWQLLDFYKELNHRLGDHKINIDSFIDATQNVMENEMQGFGVKERILVWCDPDQILTGNRLIDAIRIDLEIE